MSVTINIGAYGWRQAHWAGDFYPDDLPVAGDDDWRLAYYSNEFTTVIVPADYWRSQSEQDGKVDCEHWLDDVNDEFQFFVECDEGMLQGLSIGEIMRQLKLLRPQLSALVVLDDQSEESMSVFNSLADELGLPIQSVLRPGQRNISNLMLLEDDLTDLRSVRTIVEDYLSQALDFEQIHNDEITIIAHHHNLRAENLAKFRSVIEMMGY